jgi:hypothetical protein
MGIQIIISVSPDKANSTVSTSGSIHHIITDKEIQAFNIGETNLKNAVNNYFGKKPTYAYLHDPTPIWTNPSLYERFGWHEVETILFIQSATVTEISANTEVLSIKKLVNNSDKSATFDAIISAEIQNTVESSWSRTDAIEVKEALLHKVKFEKCGKEDETTILFNHLWGQNASESKNVKLGISKKVSTNLDPGESVEAILTASKGVMKVKVLYRASLDGHTAICYHGQKYKGHWYWALPIIGVMNAFDIDIYKDFTEEIEISFYSNPQVELRNSVCQLAF